MILAVIPRGVKESGYKLMATGVPGAGRRQSPAAGRVAYLPRAEAPLRAHRSQPPGTTVASMISTGGERRFIDELMN